MQEFRYSHLEMSFRERRERPLSEPAVGREGVISSSSFCNFFMTRGCFARQYKMNDRVCAVNQKGNRKGTRERGSVKRG
jgi:hypothetical protein